MAVVLCSVALWTALQRSETRTVAAGPDPQADRLERAERLVARLEALEAARLLSAHDGAAAPSPNAEPAAEARRATEDLEPSEPRRPPEPSGEQLMDEAAARTTLERAIAAGTFRDDELENFRSTFRRLTGAQQAELVRVTTLAMNQRKLAFDPAKLPF
jgi:hypothetical protein